MTRTKQTCRKSMGMVAPRKSVPTKAKTNGEDIDNNSQNSSEDVSSDDDGSDNSSVESDAAISEIKDRFLDPLEVIGDGSFATAGQWPNVNPGLYIEGVGKLGLPLTDRDAAAIYGVFGKTRLSDGDGSLVPKIGLKPLEISSKLMKFRNPEWQSVLINATNKALDELGLVGNKDRFTLQCHKALLDKPYTVHNIDSW